MHDKLDVRACFLYELHLGFWCRQCYLPKAAKSFCYAIVKSGGCLSRALERFEIYVVRCALVPVLLFKLIEVENEFSILIIK